MYFILTPITESVLPYLAMGLTILLEGRLSTLAAGITISGVYLRPIPIFVAIVAGNLMADMVWYNLGRYFQLDRIKRLAHRLKLNLKLIDDIAIEIRQHAPRFLFMAKLTIGLPVPSLIATGLSKVPIKRWFGMLLLAELIRSSLFVTLLFLYASAIGKASKEMQSILLTITAFVVISGVIWWKTRKRKKFGEN
ncbi:MAG: VTT domain-containing protein [Anaerolineaceae bacterium]|nr:VTT domain-containing protein [Anaerolineaceae bacterium]